MEESREEWSVHEWLEKAGMGEYIESFVDNGYDSPDLCAELQNDDLTAIGVKDKKHRSIIFSQARELLKLLSAAEITDGPVNTPAEPIVVVKQLDASSPTLPNNATGSFIEPWPSYTEPWAAGTIGVPIKLRKTGSDDKPPLPPPNKTKKKHPPPSTLPKDLPAFKRPEGAETGLTKLQLQLKIREELRGEGILLSEAPYVDEEEQMCSQPLSDLAERYSQKLKLQPLDVYDALRVVWNSENFCNVTPLTPKGNETENYDEPFDAADTAGVTPDCLKPQSSPKGGSKSHTLPPPSNGSTGNYDEPFDAVNKQQQPSSPQQQRQQLESSPERRRIKVQSKTLPSSPKITSKTAAEDKHDNKKKSKHSSADGDASPKHDHSALAKLFRRKDKGRSHSIQEFDMKQREEKKSKLKGVKISFPMRSKDTLSVGKAQKKKSGSSPRHTKHVSMKSSSETDKGSSPQPTKKLGDIKFKKFITPPTLRRDECPLSGSSSSDDSTPETVRKLRAIRSRGLTGSDLEISFRDDGETEKPWMVMSRSFDNLNDINRSAAAPLVADNEKKKEGNIFSRIFKIRTLQSPSQKMTANKEKSKKKGASANRSSLRAGYEGLAPPDGGQSLLVNSLSMPDTRTNIPVPKPRTLSRTQSSYSYVGMGAFGGSAPIKPSYLSSENRPIPEPQPRSKTPTSPTSAEGSKNQSPNTSGSDIAMLDSSRSDSISLQKSLSVPKKPPPPPKPAKITVLDDKSTEASYKFSTLPYGGGVSTIAVKEGDSPPRPIKQFSVTNGDNDQAALSQSVPSRILRESEAKKVPPTKPVRNFPIKADLQQEADTMTPLSSSAVTWRPGGGDRGDTGETSLPASGSSVRVDQTAALSSSPPTPRQRPPPKPARSIKRKPQRDRANAVVNRGGEEQTSPPKEVQRPVSGGTATPPRSNSDSSSDKMMVGGGGGGETAPTSGGPPKPIRRIKTPKVVDSSSPQMEEEKERNNGTFGGRDQSSSSGCGTGNRNEINTKYAASIVDEGHPMTVTLEPFDAADTAGVTPVCQTQSPYFNEAEKQAQVPFMCHRLVECDYNALEYTIEDHDITLRIPEGAVSKGEKFHFEIGVAMYGPFIFPEKTQIISPIVWLCIQENIELKKPLQLILPHFLIGLSRTKLQYHNITFAKASHDYFLKNGQMMYWFEDSSAQVLLATSGNKGYGVIRSTHCCFYCIRADHTPELARDAGYCLARIENNYSTLSHQRNEIFFTAVYFLGTCIKALEEQFLEEDGYKITRYDAFKFNTEQPEICIKIVPCESDQYTIALEPVSAKIRASEIDFWKEGFDRMRLKHMKRMYPPRVKMTIMYRDLESHKLLIKFLGCSTDCQLDTELALPLGSQCLSRSSSATSGSLLEHQSHTVFPADNKPELKDAFKKLLPLASNWKIIGTLLGLRSDVLERIQLDKSSTMDHLQTVTSEWLKQVNPPPTWKSLADAIEVIDEQKAQELREHLAL